MSFPEIWKEVVSYEGYYFVSSLGRIRNKKGEILKLSLNKGYLRFDPSKKGKQSHLYVHRAVITAFTSNPDNLPLINHKNGIKIDNNVDNLEWSNEKKNAKHARETGLYKTGEDSGKAKLKNRDIIMIMILLKTRRLNRNEVATLFNTNNQTPLSILKKGLWSDVVNKYFDKNTVQEITNTYFETGRAEKIKVLNHGIK